jgi:nitrogen-specific signal transduction histidine kinase
VILNLVMNGIEAMQSVEDRPRELVIRSRQDKKQLTDGPRDDALKIVCAGRIREIGRRP